MTSLLSYCYYSLCVQQAKGAFLNGTLLIFFIAAASEHGRFAYWMKHSRTSSGISLLGNLSREDARQELEIPPEPQRVANQPGDPIILPPSPIATEKQWILLKPRREQLLTLSMFWERGRRIHEIFPWIWTKSPRSVILPFLKLVWVISTGTKTKQRSVFLLWIKSKLIINSHRKKWKMLFFMQVEGEKGMRSIPSIQRRQRSLDSNSRERAFES